MKKEINVFDHSEAILKALHHGVLVTTKTNDEVNTMVISWGALGYEWRKPLFTIYVKKSRHTKDLLDANGEFTVNIPVGDFDQHVLDVCGKESGRDIDKIKSLGLTLVDPDKISVPGIKEFPMTLECKVVYKHIQQNYEGWRVPLADEVNENYQTVYYGEIVSAYIVE